MSGAIAIVGRPNVGKSAIFNRIVGRRIAIVHDRPGVTRDRISAEAEWRGRPFTLIDTGGIGLVRGEKAGDHILEAAVAQVHLAVESSDVIILVVDIQEGTVPMDIEVAGELRQAGKPVLLAVNKADNEGQEAGLTDFSQLGFEQMFPVSAIHHRGIGPLMKAAVELLPREKVDTVAAEDEPEGQAGTTTEEEAPLKLAVVGRPNVGKSSLINELTQAKRVIVSEVPGTTRDAVDVPLEVDTDGVRQRYLLIDTAGMRKARRVNDSIEFFSVKRAEGAIRRSDIVVFVLDAETGIREQDKKIADRIVEARKGCVLVVNKWDLFKDAVDETEKTRSGRTRKQTPARGPKPTKLQRFATWVQEKLFFLDYAPVIFTSAKTGFHLDDLLEAVRFVAAQLRQQIPTALLNRTLHDAIERRQPITASGARLKFFYATQVAQAPPTFVLFVSRHELFTRQYEKYLTGELRKAFGFEGCPIVLIPRARPKKEISRPRGRREGSGKRSQRGRPSTTKT